MRPLVFVVEGKNDAFKLEQVLDRPLVITTNGSAIDDDAILLLKKLDETHDIVLFLDPDHAGDRIRRLVSKELNHVYHAFIRRDQSTSKNMKKVGVEHASKEDIVESLKHLKMVHHESSSNITHAFLHEHYLTGHPMSKAFRHDICQRLGIGSTNGKTLYHRLHLFGIQEEDLLEVIHESLREKEVWTKLFKG
ncbi:MAG TPA: ribonuclease M5 [Acholeplasmataceae bacterium]|nr:ribonuclease M5 [Acholeplasmataceae bacterium]